MTTRIELILKTQNLTPTQFADAIGIQRSSMSHILARRNNPSLDFVMKVLARFPEISSEWLLTGKGQMHKTGAPLPPNTLFPPPPQEPKATDFEWNSDAVATPPVAPPIAFPIPPIAHPQTLPPPPSEPGSEQKEIPLVTKRDPNQNSDIERIIVFFTDGTFKSYS